MFDARRRFARQAHTHRPERKTFFLSRRNARARKRKRTRANLKTNAMTSSVVGSKRKSTDEKKENYCVDCDVQFVYRKRFKTHRRKKHGDRVDATTTNHDDDDDGDENEDDDNDDDGSSHIASNGSRTIGDAVQSPAQKMAQQPRPPPSAIMPFGGAQHR